MPYLKISIVKLARIYLFLTELIILLDLEKDAY